MIDFREDEHVIFEIRKHWFIILSEIFALIILALAPLLIPEFLKIFEVKFNFLIDGQNLWPVYIFFYCLWLLFLWIIGFVFWTNYYLDVWIVTNEKIIDVEQMGLFSRNISTLHLDKIQDVTTEVSGIISTFLKFGDIVVQTAGRENMFVIRGVSDPDNIAKRLNDVLIKYRGHIGLSIQNSTTHQV